MNELMDLTRQAKRNLHYDQPLDPEQNHTLMVELNDCRGEFSEDSLIWKLDIDELDLTRKYILFGGHRGCGKSTELRRLAKILHQPEQYYIVFVDALIEIDINNLNYSDILLAQAKVLFQQFETDNIKLDPIFMTTIEDWFNERIKTHLDMSDFKYELKTGFSAETGLPFLGKLFASLTSSINANSTHKDEIRIRVQNSFSQFATAFNSLIAHAEEVLTTANKGKRILFIVDGTDRLRSDQAKQFFNYDVHQLKQIAANFIYCTPIAMLNEDGRIAQEFEIIRLPMIKIAEKASTDLDNHVLAKLQEFINKRVSNRLFADPELQITLIRYSGGHLRDLMRLLDNCLAETRGLKTIDQASVEAAMKQLATDYQRIIRPDDYKLLADIDSKDRSYLPITEESRRLLYDLVLLEYNTFWWQTHPIVTRLPAYQQAKNALT